QVLADQREPCLRVIEARHLPVALAVAGLAARAELVLVLVVLLVARHAGGRGGAVGLGVTVAGLAGPPGGCLGPSQREARLVVVEARRGLPVALVVAALALRAERGLVPVVLPVAADAVAGCLLEVVAAVAVGALHRGMAPEQRELRALVIEAGALL